MKRIALPNETAAKTGFTDMIEIVPADLTAAGNTQTLAILGLNPGDLLTKVATKLVVPFDFSDATLISLAGTVGDGGSAARFLASQEFAVDGTEVLFKEGTNAQLAYTVADTLDLFLTGTAAKLLNTATVGKLHIFVGVIRLNLLSDPQI